MKGILIAMGKKPPRCPGRSGGPLPGWEKVLWKEGMGLVVPQTPLQRFIAQFLYLPYSCSSALNPLPSQHVQTKTKAKASQAAGPSSQQRPPTPEETKPATPELQEDADSEGEQSGQLEGGGPGVEAWVSRRRDWRLSKGKLGLVSLASGLGPDMRLGA